MVTYKVCRVYDNDSTYIEGVCVSSDAKPTANIQNGSLLMEMDTSILYMFDEANETWREWE